jgi:hypothetical protein
MPMPITISERGFPQFYVSRHFIAYSLGGGRHTIVRSGIVLLPNESGADAQNAGRPWTPSGFRGNE